MSVYLPLATDEAKRSTLYNAENLAWAAQGKWDEWLEDYWQAATQPPEPIAISACDQTVNCPSLSGWGFLPDAPTAVYYHFIPLVQR